MVKTCVVATLLSTVGANVMLASFGPSDDTFRSWKQQNDPVMGALSKGTFTVSNGVGTMEGVCAIVPALGVPGFIKATASGSYADVSACAGIELEVQSTSNPDPYTGYRFGFGNDKSACDKFFARGYKADFAAPSGAFGKVQIPFDQFTRCWDDSTHEVIKTCAEDPDVCPTQTSLQDLDNLVVWAEGAEGTVKIDIKSVSSYGCQASLEEVVSDEIALESFDAPVHAWSQKNDPVMGGKSTGTFTIEDGVGTMEGTCALIPSLNAPGFIKVVTTDSAKFPDISSCQGLALTTRSASTPASYNGYRVSFGSDSAFLTCGKFFARGFKADFAAGEGEFKTVQVPFDMFTKCWDDATGEAVKTCKENPEFCPTQSRLSDLQTISIWAEGEAADVKLDIQKVAAYGCSTLV